MLSVTEQTHYNMESICFFLQRKLKKKKRTHKISSYRFTFRGFVRVKVHFKSPRVANFRLCFFFSIILISRPSVEMTLWWCNLCFFLVVRYFPRTVMAKDKSERVLHGLYCYQNVQSFAVKPRTCGSLFHLSFDFIY